MNVNETGMKRGGTSAGTDGKGASAGKTPPVVEHLVIEGFAEDGARCAACGARDKSGQNGTGYSAAYGAERAAQRTDDRAGFAAGQRGGGPARGTCCGADCAADASGNVPLLGTERFTRWTGIHQVTLAGPVTRAFPLAGAG